MRVVVFRCPQVHTVEALVEGVITFLRLFELLYLSLSSMMRSSFSEPLGGTNLLVHVSSTFATVGLGGVIPAARNARALVWMQIATGLGLLGMGEKSGVSVAKR